MTRPAGPAPTIATVVLLLRVELVMSDIAAGGHTSEGTTRRLVLRKRDRGDAIVDREVPVDERKDARREQFR